LSSCIVLQQKNNIFIASDTAISSTVNGSKVRLSNSSEKIFRKDEHIIFCSGNMEIATKCSMFIKQMNAVNVEEVRKYISSFCIDDEMFEIFIVKTGDIVESYQLSSYNGFNPIKRIVDNNTEIFALGYNTINMLNSFEKYLMNTDVISAIKNTFNDNICTEVGGNIDIFYFYNGSIHQKHNKLDDNTECLISELDSKHCELVIAETLLGKILLGEKLVITADNGQFYVGPGETQEQKDKNEFGIYIYDSVGGVDRIFLGLGEVEENGIKVRKAQLRLKDKTGRQVVLSEDGIVQTSQFVCWDNVSPNFPMRIPYFCDAGVVENRKIVLSMVFEKYRAFERGMTSGGQLQSTPSGGGGTTPAGGGGTSEAGGTTSFSGGGTTSRTDGGRTVQSTSADGGGATVGHTILASNITGNPQYQETIDLGPSNDVADYGRHYHRVSHQFYVHGHNVDVRIPSHRHSVTVSVPSHTHEIPDHTHNIAQHRHTLPDHTHTIPNHTHTLDTTHSHQLEYGIFEQESNCSNVRVYVNNVLAGQNINSNVDLDITQHIRINQRNDIRIETQTNGRITCNLFTKSFVAF
jgi:hypothetical protein